MSEGKSLWEIVAGVMSQALPGIQESEMKSQPSSPLPPKQARWVSTHLVTPGSSVEPDVYPILNPSPFHKTGPVSISFSDPGTKPGDGFSMFISPLSQISDYTETGDRGSKEEG